MQWLHQLRLRIKAISRRRQLDRDLDEELRFHLEMKTARNRDSGLDSRQAIINARREFGSPVKWKESIRYMWTMGFLESVFHDLRFAGRSLAKTKGFTIAA